MTDFIQVSTTTDSQELAHAIASALVEQRLASCVQITGPAESVYRWESKVEQAQEWLCTAKTRRALFAQVKAAICEVHSYDCPEIIAVAIAEGSADYLKWLDHELDRP